MSLIKEEVMEEFSVWAGKNEDKHIFPVIDKEESSYYIDRESEDTYMMPYSFETVAELKKLMEEYSGLSEDLQMLNKLTVEIYKARFRGKKAVEEESAGKKTELPEFVYVF